MDTSKDELPELEAIGWYMHAEEVASTSFLRMLKRLPHLALRALGLAWRASKVMTVATIVLNIAAGAATTFGLMATRDAAQALFAGEPSWDRIITAVPSLAVIAVAAAARSGLGIAAGWAQARLKPLATQAVEREFYDLTSAVPVAAYDEDTFSDDMQRSRNRGAMSSVELVSDTVDVITGVVGVAAVGVALAIIHPLLLPLLVVSVLPIGWAAVRSARIQYLSHLSRITRQRRLWLVEELMASRRTAAELRAYQMRDWILGEHQWMQNAENRADFDVLARQTTTRVWGSLAAGVASVAVYAALLWMLATGQVALAAGAAAVLALQQGAGSMRLLINAINNSYEDGMYASDHVEFCQRAAERLSPSPILAPSGQAVPAPRVIPPGGCRFALPRR